MNKDSHKFYVVIGQNLFPVSNIFEAVDVLFKSISVLRKNFLPACAHIWQFLEKKKFDLNILPGKTLQTCSNLITNLDKTIYSLRKKKSKK